MDAFDFPGCAQERTCRCGRTYRLSESQLGLPLECSQCGEVFVALRPDQVIEPVRLIGAEADELAQRQAELCPRTPGALLTVAEARFEPSFEPVIEDALHQAREEALKRQVRASRFRRDLGWNILLFTDARNLAPLLFIWLLVSAEIFLVSVSLGAPTFVFVILALILALLIEGVVHGVLMGALDAAACGEQEIPRPPMVEEILSDWPALIFEPLLVLGVAALMAFGPGLLLFVILCATASGYAEVPVGGWIAVGALAGGGLLLWPAMMLMAVTGEVADLLRVDLMVRTIRRTLGSYLTVCAYVLVAAALVAGAFLAPALINSPWIPKGFLLALLLSAVRCYGQCVVMRAVGLFAWHFRRKFAWDWM